ncbi:hypothetical protein K502DRAFT_343361 [Neoconidiobolus thromboides FSU 785]|nr:hypothetical protein K502DRAFT_343361 [Neoconidiobolus thromboides FSU 785]
MALQSMYPFYGILYFLTHPQLWREVFCVNIGALVGFSFVIKPTVDALFHAGCALWVSYLIAIPLYFIEVAIVALLFVAIFLPILIENIFLKTIELKGYKESLMDNYAPNMDYQTFLAGIFYGLVQVSVALLCLPLNVIPIIGTVMYCYCTGIILAWGYRIPEMLYYRGMTFWEGKEYVMNHLNQFGSFGMVATFLELIPLFNWFFIFTNSVGAALWAVDEYLKDSKNGTYYSYRKDRLTTGDSNMNNVGNGSNITGYNSNGNEGGNGNEVVNNNSRKQANVSMV